jgi:hypothetical protein
MTKSGAENASELVPRVHFVSEAKMQRRMWSGCDDEGHDKYDLVTMSYHEESGINVADSVEYEKFEHVAGQDDPAVTDSLDDMLSDIEAHPCELNRMTNQFEVVDCWDGCPVCKAAG